MEKELAWTVSLFDETKASAFVIKIYPACWVAYNLFYFLWWY